MNIYLAGPIFTYGDYLRNTEWAAKIRKAFPGVNLYSPVENTAINGVEGKKKFAGSREVGRADNERLDNTDILVACIDGDVLPSGTCAEIGKFHEKIARGDNKYIIGICTDNRQCYLTHSAEKDIGGAKELGEQQYSYQNIYVTSLIKEYGVLVSNIDDVIEEIRKAQHKLNVKKAERLVDASMPHSRKFATKRGTNTTTTVTKDDKNHKIDIDVEVGDDDILSALLESVRAFRKILCEEFE